MIADQLRTIAARLILCEESKVDGLMTLSLASEVATLESRLAEHEEDLAELAMELNDPLNTIQRIVAKRTTGLPNGPREKPH